MHDFRREFLRFAMARGVLKFGQFTTKAGRETPYFFNAGLFADGDSLRQLGRFYADAWQASGLPCDQLFGPAYKGITLAAAMAIALAEKGHNLPFSYNRKEAKDHGEGGVVVGAPLSGRVLIVDDVITDGGAKRESIELIRAHGATPAGVVIGFDRMERGKGASVGGGRAGTGFRGRGRCGRDARSSAGAACGRCGPGGGSCEGGGVPGTVRRRARGGGID